MNTSKNLHVRRCHVCGEVSESREDITKCLSCKKSLLPFYYFDKRKISEYSDNEERPGNFKNSKDTDIGYGPIRGLTAYW